MATDATDDHGQAPIRDVKDLDVWRKSVALCKSVYEATRAFPRDELYGLASQMRRAAVSIPSNLAEGYGRGSRKDYRQFVIVARGSASELDTQAVIAHELGFLGEPEARALTERVQEVLRMLSGLARSLSPVPSHPSPEEVA